MPVSELHKKKLKKNIAVLLAVVCFMVIVFFVTVIRIQTGLGNAEATETAAESNNG